VQAFQRIVVFSHGTDLQHGRMLPRRPSRFQ
jgi:hypothetical protein